MKKTKYLHRKYRRIGSRGYDDPEHRKLYRGKNLNLLYDDLPKRVRFGTDYTYGVDFTPLSEFLESKIGEDWNDVYSELITKVKGKFRYMLDDCVLDRSWYIERPIYGDDYLPRDNYGRVMDNWLFIDRNNIISKKPKEEIIADAKKLLRKQKLLEILKNQENEEIVE